MARISVVIPTYNRVGTVEHAINSALNQTRPANEIVVVDDGSQDDTREQLKKYGEKIHYLYQKNAGVSAARNAGILAAKSEWVAFLDSDDEWDNRRIEWFEQDFLKWPHAVAHVGNAVFMSGAEILTDQLHLRGLTARPGHSELIEHPLLMYLRIQCMTSTFAVRKDCLGSVGGFDPALPIFEDYRLFSRIAMRGKWVLREDAVARMFRRGPAASNTFANLSERALKGATSCIGTYSSLLNYPELSRAERLLIRRRLAGYRAQVAAHKRNRGQWVAALRDFSQSIVDFPSTTAIIRALVGASCGQRGLDLLSKIRRKPSTSELNR